jgi:hypothetical protein
LQQQEHLCDVRQAKDAARTEKYCEGLCQKGESKMDYIFGVVERNGVTVENLKTVGQSHTNLGGFTQTVREYTDSTITDRFRVVEKYRSEEDAEGNCYDWYLIDQHYRYVDKTTQVAAETADHDELPSQNWLTVL